MLCISWNSGSGTIKCLLLQIFQFRIVFMTYKDVWWLLEYTSLPRMIICSNLILFPWCKPAHWQHFGYFKHTNLSIKLDFVHMLYVHWTNTIFLIIWDDLYFIPKHWLPFFSHKTLPLFHFTPFTLITTGLPYLASFVEWLPGQWVSNLPR